MVPHRGSKEMGTRKTSVEIDEEIAVKARRSVERMVELGGAPVPG